MSTAARGRCVASAVCGRRHGLPAAGPQPLEVRVANLALNALAGHALPDYRLLSARYGQRFVPQDTALVAPQPAGLLGPVQTAGPTGEQIL
jgi:hypothetical protein